MNLNQQMTVNQAMSERFEQALIDVTGKELTPRIPLIPAVAESFRLGKLVDSVTETLLVLRLYKPNDLQLTPLANLIPLINILR